MHRGGREQPVDASVVAPLHHRAKWRQEEGDYRDDITAIVIYLPSVVSTLRGNHERSVSRELLAAAVAKQ